MTTRAKYICNYITSKSDEHGAPEDACKMICAGRACEKHLKSALSSDKKLGSLLTKVYDSKRRFDNHTTIYKCMACDSYHCACIANSKLQRESYRKAYERDVELYNEFKYIHRDHHKIPTPVDPIEAAAAHVAGLQRYQDRFHRRYY